VTVERRAKSWSSIKLTTVARNLMNASPLCAIATISPGARAHISHVYFAWTDIFDVCWISDPDSLHSRNLAKNPSAAVTVFKSAQVWGRPDRGMQLHGTAAEVSGRVAREAEHAYAARFKTYGGTDDALCFYRFRPRTVQLFDERYLAPGTLVKARVTKDGLTWLRTEVWT